MIASPTDELFTPSPKASRPTSRTRENHGRQAPVSGSRPSPKLPSQVNPSTPR
jgi:hypothetical protein